MTNEEILELAETCGFADGNAYGDIYWDCWEEELMPFETMILIDENDLRDVE
jgi:hypothetical protein